MNTDCKLKQMVKTIQLKQSARNVVCIVYSISLSQKGGLEVRYRRQRLDARAVLAREINQFPEKELEKFLAEKEEEE